MASNDPLNKQVKRSRKPQKKEVQGAGEEGTETAGNSTPDGQPPVLVGVGASAGALEILEPLFAAIPPGSGIAFVVIVHLAPYRKSLLPELLQRHTSLRVLSADSAMPLEPDTVYVAPAGMELTIAGRYLAVAKSHQPDSDHLPIDRFFRMLADVMADRAIGLVLTGSGSDGTRGAAAIRERGGIVLVQDPATAPYPGMPRSVIAARAADMVLPPARIPGKLVEIARHVPHRPAEEATAPGTDDQLLSLFDIVRARTGNDLGCYKESTVMRRLDRRMAVHGAKSIEEYVAVLKEMPGEPEALSSEILIGVTSFFRDPEAFEILEKEIVPRLFAGRLADDPVRIWLASCSSGEEAYSLAILISEYRSAAQFTTPVQIFATDLDETAIARARAGLYPVGIEADVGAERLRTFFAKTDAGYQVIKPLREMIVFARHSIIKDPPFSRLDLLVCRNLLIYLNSVTQKRLMTLFHLALKPGGVLFLGSSETVGRSSELFTVIDKKWKIFRCRKEGQRAETALSLLPQLRPLPMFWQQSHLTHGHEDNSPKTLIEKLIVDRYSFPSVVVNEKYEMVYVSAKAGGFLRIPGGEPTNDILKMVKEELRPPLRAAIHSSIAEQKHVVFRRVKVGVPPEEEVNISVEPASLPSLAAKLAVVLFEQAPAPATASHSPEGGDSRSGDESTRDMLIRQLEEQLKISNDQLQATIEQLETSNEGFMSTNEELISINEEFQSTNEELQSTNEELETSKEELQALNEELVTLNAELEGKVEELDRANNDMENLLTSSEIATIFLDRRLVIKRFTPAMAAILHMIPADVGRPFQHLSGGIDLSSLIEDSGEVLAGRPAVEREAFAPNAGRWYLMRVLPYRNGDGEVDGIVVTLIDITERKRAERRDELLADIAGELLRTDSTQEVVDRLCRNVMEFLDCQAFFNFLVDEASGRLRLNAYGGIHAEEAGRIEWLDFGAAVCGAVAMNACRIVAENIGEIEDPRTELVKSYGIKAYACHPLLVEGRVLGTLSFGTAKRNRFGDEELSLMKTVADHVAIAMQRMRAAEALRLSEGRYRGLFDHMLEGFAYCQMVADEGGKPDFVYLAVNETFETLTGLKNVIGKRVSEVIPGIRETDPGLLEIYGRVAATGVPERFEMLVESLDMWFSISVYSPEEGFFVAVFDVISERKKNEALLRDSEARYRSLFTSMQEAFALLEIVADQDGAAVDASFVEVNPAFEQYVSTVRDRLIGSSFRELFPSSGDSLFDSILAVTTTARPVVREEYLPEIGRHFEAHFYSPAAGKVAAVLTDVTERKKLQDEQEKAVRLESLGLLAGGIAHDFNNILTAIVGNISLARKKLGEESPAGHELLMSEAALAKATELTRQLLTFARGGEPVKGTVTTGKLIEEAVKFCLHGSKCKGKVEIPPDVWPLDADMGQIHQVLNNLLINAVQAMPDGGTIAVKAGNETVGPDREEGIAPGQYVSISIADQGSGIPAENLARIFDPYFTTKPEGSGIGLASVFSIIKRHGGRIDVVSEPGNGTTFTLLLPAAGGDAVERADAEKTGSTPLAAERQASVLVMDDEEMIRSVAASILEHLGYRPFTCADGVEAVALYHEALQKGKRYDVVILDMTVPGGMGGKEAAERILAMDPTALLVISTGYSVDFVNSNGAGLFRGAVSKPYNLQQLGSELARLCTLIRTLP